MTDVMALWSRTNLVDRDDLAADAHHSVTAVVTILVEHSTRPVAATRLYFNAPDVRVIPTKGLHIERPRRRFELYAMFVGTVVAIPLRKPYRVAGTNNHPQDHYSDNKQDYECRFSCLHFTLSLRYPPPTAPTPAPGVDASYSFHHINQNINGQINLCPVRHDVILSRQSMFCV